MAMISCEKNCKNQDFIISEKDKTVETKFYNEISPSKFFLQQLDNPNNVKRPIQFLQVVAP